MQSSQREYRIRVKGRLELSWSDCLCGMTIENLETDGELASMLSGPLADQSALAGVVSALVDLHYEVLSVECVEAERIE